MNNTNTELINEKDKKSERKFIVCIQLSLLIIITTLIIVFRGYIMNSITSTMKKLGLGVPWRTEKVESFEESYK